MGTSDRPPTEGPTSPTALLWSSTRTAATPFGIALGLIGLFYAYAPDVVPRWLLLVFLVIAAASTLLLFACLLDVRKFLVPTRPVVDQGMPPHDPYSDAKAVIITSRCSSLHQGSPVTIEISVSGYEKEIGYGRIVKIQSDGKAVLTIDQWCGAPDREITEGIMQNRKDVISRLIVRPDWRKFTPAQGDTPVIP